MAPTYALITRFILFIWCDTVKKVLAASNVKKLFSATGNVLVAEASENSTVPRPNGTGLVTWVSLGSVVPCSVQVDLTRVQLNVFLLIKDAVDDGLQHLVQIQHANGL